MLERAHHIAGEGAGEREEEFDYEEEIKLDCLDEVGRCGDEGGG